MKTVFKRVTKDLMVKLSDSELLRYGKEIGEAKSECERVEEAAKSAAAEFKAKLTEINGRINKLARFLGTGEERRGVECSAFYDYSNARVTVTRTDTEEVIEDRPMEEGEKQMENGLA